MKPPKHQIRECLNPNCGLRYPISEGTLFTDRCPICLGATKKVISFSSVSKQSLANPKLVKIEVLLDNIRSVWNVGSIFRTAEGFNVKKIHLSGITPTPDSSEISKTALGAETRIPWSYYRNAVAAAHLLRSKGYKLWALECTPTADSIYSVELPPPSGEPKGIILILGNEVSGVDPGLLEFCQKTIYIPMHGKKESFNVEVACGIALGILVRDSK
jgi:23S rRNA (guanosine2251-2'-O)-methyltransferase